MLMSIEIGRDNFPGGSVKANVFLCPLGAGAAKECHLWMVGTNKVPPGTGAGIQKVGAPQVVPAGVGLSADIVGKWTTQVYDLPPGTLLKVNLTRSQNGNHRSANMLLRLREGAPLQRINVDTTPNAKASKNRLVYEGRFDILTPDQAQAAGYVIPTAFAPTYNTSRWASYGFVRVETLAPETISQPVVRTKRVINSQGDTVEVQTAAKKRQLDL